MLAPDAFTPEGAAAALALAGLLWAVVIIKRWWRV